MSSPYPENVDIQFMLSLVEVLGVLLLISEHKFLGKWLSLHQIKRNEFCELRDPHFREREQPAAAVLFHPSSTHFNQAVEEVSEAMLNDVPGLQNRKQLDLYQYHIFTVRNPLFPMLKSCSWRQCGYWM